nr:MAG TPA: hypothetical protein [Bacteriophage sp.]
MSEGGSNTHSNPTPCCGNQAVRNNAMCHRESRVKRSNP